MRTLILAGGYGSRLSEETVARPKPMVEIGSQPILWHILKHYSFHGYRDFVIALGYRGEMVKQYFAQYAAPRPGSSSDRGRTSVRTGPCTWSTRASRWRPAAACDGSPTSSTARS
jgi:glucose-1-phosphate cytidylyltransferase